MTGTDLRKSLKKMKGDKPSPCLSCSDDKILECSEGLNSMLCVRLFYKGPDGIRSAEFFASSKEEAQKRIDEAFWGQVVKVVYEERKGVEECPRYKSYVSSARGIPWQRLLSRQGLAVKEEEM